jgi:hypothetical protein
VNLNQKVNDHLNKEIDSLKQVINNLKNENEELSNNYRNLAFLSDGESEECPGVNSPDSCYSIFYRVEIYTTEIYSSLHMNKMCYYDEGVRKLLKDLKIPIEEKLKISSEHLGTLKFLNWKSSRSFEFFVDQKKYLLTLAKDDNYSIEEIKD